MIESRASRRWSTGLLLVFVAITLLPLAGIVRRALSDPQAFERAWTVGELESSLLTSAVVAFGVTLGATALSVLAGYAFGTMRFRGERLLFALFLLGLVMPVEVLIIPLFFGMRSVGLTDTVLGLVLPHVALFLSFGVFWMRASFQAFPSSLIEAAKMDGASSWTTLAQVLAPATRPAITTLLVIFFTWSWNSFLLPLVLAPGGEVSPVALSLSNFVGQRQTDYPGLAAATIIVSVPVVLVYVVLQRSFIRGVVSGGVKA